MLACLCYFSENLMPFELRIYECILSTLMKGVHSGIGPETSSIIEV